MSISLPAATHTCPSTHNSANDDIIGNIIVMLLHSLCQLYLNSIIDLYILCPFFSFSFSSSFLFLFLFSFFFIGMLFSEELGIVLEVLPKNVDRVTSAFAALKLPCVLIGHTTVEKEVNVSVGTYIAKLFCEIYLIYMKMTSYDVM
jgi:hypothetical protein